MSFWERVGDFFEDLGTTAGSITPIGVAWNAAQAIKEGKGYRETGQALADKSLAVFKNRDVATALDAVPQSVSYTAGNLDALIRRGAPDVSWRDVEDVSPGQALSSLIMSTSFGPGTGLESPATERDFDLRDDAQRKAAMKDNFAGRVSSGALDVAVAWFADPLVVGGKAAKVARLSRTTAEGAEVGRVVGALEEGGQAASFGTARRAKAFEDDIIKGTDGFDSIGIMARLGPALRETTDAGAVATILSSANRITDDSLRWSVKRDTWGTLLGDEIAATRLKDAAPDVFDELKRVSRPPEGFLAQLAYEQGEDTYSLLQRLNADDSLDKYANAEAAETMLSALQRLEDQRGVLGRVGLDARDRLAAQRREATTEYWLSGGAVGTGERVLHFTIGNKVAGSIETADVMQGFDELGEYLAKAPGFNRATREQALQDFIQAPSQEARNAVLYKVEDTVYAAVAARRGVSVERARELATKVRANYEGYRAALGRAYSEAKNIHGENVARVRFRDEDGVVHNLPSPFIEAQLTRRQGMIDPKNLDDALAFYEGAGGMRMAGKQAAKLLDSSNILWKQMALARPGYFMRVQLDTQIRSMAYMGAPVYLSLAAKGLGHSVADLARLPRRDLARVTLTARQMMVQDGLIDESADLLTEAASLAPRITQAEGRYAKLTGLGDQGVEIGYRYQKAAEAAEARVPELEKAVATQRARVKRALQAQKRATKPQSRQKAADRLAAERAELRRLVDNLSSVQERAMVARQRSDEYMDPSLVLEQADSLKARQTRLRERADARRAEADAVPETARAGNKGKRRLGMTPFEVRPGVAGQAYEDNDDFVMMLDRLQADRPVSEAMVYLGDSSTRALRLREGEWGKTYTNDPTWETAYLRDVNRQVRNSPAARAMLSMEDFPYGLDAKKLFQDKKIKAEWRNFRGRYENNFGAWVDDVAMHVQYMLPTQELRQIARVRDVTSDDVIRTFGPKPSFKEDTVRVTPPPRRPLDFDSGAEATGRSLVDEEAAQAAGKRALEDLTLDSKGKVLGRQADFVEAGIGDDVIRESAQEAADNLKAQLPDRSADLPPRPIVHGPGYTPIINDTVGSIKDALFQKAFRFLSDMPDTILGRHPMYVARFQRHFKDMVNRLDLQEGVEAKELYRVQQMARARAVKDVHQTLFNTRRVSNLAYKARWFSPFMTAFEDAGRSWARMFYDDPSRLARMQMAWDAPEKIGMIDEDEFGQKSLVMPLPGFVERWSGADEFRINKNSFNSIFQGEPWWFPGFGPLVQVPTAEIMRRGSAEMVDKNPVLKLILPFGVPKPGPAQQVMPSWARRFADAFDENSAPWTEFYRILMAEEVNKYNNGVRDKPPTMDEVAKKTTNAMLLRAVFSGAMAWTGDPQNRMAFYKDQYDNYRRDAVRLREERGLTPDEAFLQDFPEAPEIIGGSSVNETGINATPAAAAASRTFKKEIAANPDMGWFFVGAENIGGEFSPSVYTQQLTTDLGFGNTSRGRRKMSAKEALDASQRAQGWALYGKANTALQLELERRGLRSFRQKGAEDLAELKREVVAYVTDKYGSAWREDYDKNDSGAVGRFLRTASQFMDDPRLRDRGDVVLLRRYIAARTEMQKVLAERGGNLDSPDNADLAELWDGYVSELVQQDISFEQMYQRILQRDNLSQDM